MKQLVIFNDKLPPSYGGMESHLKNMNLFFNKHKKWKCKYLISRNGNKHFIYLTTYEKVNSFETLEETLKFLKNDVKPDVLFFNNAFWIEELSIVKKYLQTPLIVLRTGGNEFAKAPLTNSTLKIDERQKIWANQINNFCNIVISNSNYTDKRLIDIGVARDKIFQIRGGVDLEECRKNINDKEKNRTLFSEKYNIKRKNIVTCCSRLVEFKGIKDVICSINKSKYSNDIFFICIGDGELEQELKKLSLEKLGLNNFLFTGALKYYESMKIISISDIFCSGSIELEKKSQDGFYIHTETMGRSLLEAIAQNVKIVATNVGGVAQWFTENNYIGHLVSNSITDISKAINGLVDSENVVAYQPMQEYSWEQVFYKYIEIWEGNEFE